MAEARINVKHTTINVPNLRLHRLLNLLLNSLKQEILTTFAVSFLLSLIPHFVAGGTGVSKPKAADCLSLCNRRHNNKLRNAVVSTTRIIHAGGACL